MGIIIKLIKNDLKRRCEKMFICINCDKNYVREKSFIKHELICKKDIDKTSIQYLVEKLESQAREIRLLKKQVLAKNMDIEEWLEEYYKSTLDYNDIIIDCSVRDLKHLFYNTVTQGIDRIIEHQNLECIKVVQHKIYYFKDGQWKAMPDKELTKLIQLIVRNINQVFDQYVMDEKLLENEDGKYAEYTYKLYQHNLDKIIKKTIYKYTKVEFP